jgi:2-keto-3-deoxy-L-rhamnonate aldolase RhmA
MRWSVVLGAVGVIGLGGLACAEPEEVQTTERLNQMIPLIEQGLPVLGIAHPPYAARRRRGGRGAGASEAPPEVVPEPDIGEAAREMVAYQLGDYELNTYSPASVDRYREFMRAIVEAGGSARTHPFVAKIPIMHRDPAETTQRLIDQLNDGQVAIEMQQVETVEEVNQAIAAMRFTSKGGVRPEEGFERAAAYWGMTEEQYLEKADVWPINPNGELLISVIIESKEGVANARAISAMPGVAVVTVGSGTLGGVFSSTNAEGERVRDQEGFDAAVATVLAACKEFNKSCGYPANNPDQVEALMADGWDFLIMQRRNQDAFDAVLTGRRLSGRPLEGG